MDAHSAFKLLTSGTRFKRAGPAVAKEKKALPADAPAVDFFADVGAGSGEKKSKEKKRPHEASSSEADAAAAAEAASHADKRQSKKAKKSAGSTESVAEYRASQRLHVKGTDVPAPSKTFAEMWERFGVAKFLQTNINNAGYTKPTPIQQQAASAMMMGRDVVGVAPTGSGKTAAFLIPILHTLTKTKKEKISGIHAIIVSPTRELARQIHQELTKLSVGRRLKTVLLTKATAAGEMGAHSAGSGIDVLVATPLRLLNLLESGEVRLKNSQWLVLDEADKLFSERFVEQTDALIAHASGAQQEKRDGLLRRGLFSATMPPLVEEMAATFMVDPVVVSVGERGAASSTVHQRLLFVGREEGKLLAMRQLIRDGIKPPVLVFVQSIERAKQLFHELVYDGLCVDVIHAERTQAQRDLIVSNFRQAKIWVLITTDLLARGMDFKGVNMVVNYDFPQSAVSYVHRVGRTGRAGRAGEAVTFFTEEDKPNLRTIANVVVASGSEVPAWMLTLKAPNKDTKRRLAHSAPTRSPIYQRARADRQLAAHRKQMISDSKAKSDKERSEEGIDA